MSRPIYTPRAADARELMTEHELFDAFVEGLRCAELAAKKIAVRRAEPRWSQVGLLLDTIRKKGEALGRDKRMAPLLNANGMRVN